MAKFIRLAKMQVLFLSRIENFSIISYDFSIETIEKTYKNRYIRHNPLLKTPSNKRERIGTDEMN